MVGWFILALLAWAALQFRPARRMVWASRWTRLVVPLGKFLGAAGTMLWQGFVRDPVRRLWRAQSAKWEARAGIDAALEKLLGRGDEDR